MSETSDLIKRLENATGPDRALDIAIGAYLDATWDWSETPHGAAVVPFSHEPPHYTGSIDAAMTLVPAAQTPAIALCIAALKAREHPMTDRQDTDKAGPVERLRESIDARYSLNGKYVIVETDLAKEAVDALEQAREALNEVVTNGEWTGGEQLGDWKISREVYDAVRDLLSDKRAEAKEGE